MNTRRFTSELYLLKTTLWPHRTSTRRALVIDLLRSYTHTIHFTVHLRSVLAYPRTHGSSDAAMLGCATHVPHPQRACLSTTSTVYSCHFISRASDCATSACGMQIIICRQPWLAGAINSSAWSSWNSHSTAASCEAPAHTLRRPFRHTAPHSCRHRQGNNRVLGVRAVVSAVWRS